VAKTNPRGAGRKPLLSQTAIVAAAMRLIEREGLDALTIRNVASELGVKSASLYWHFPSKEALVDRLADEVLEGLAPTPPRDDWRDDLRVGALALFRHLRARRDSARLRAGRLVTGPNTLRWMEAGLVVFRRAGLSDTDAAYASHAVHVFTLGSVIFAASPLSADHTRGGSAAAALAAARGAFQALEPTRYPNIVELAAPLTEGDAETRFLYGLDCLIAGMERRVSSRKET
jgi:TetR/AcrR family tetracycline transcriptional repressor